MYEALLEHPGKAWNNGELMQISGLSEEHTRAALDELARLGAVEWSRGLAQPTGRIPVRGGYTEPPWAQRARVTADGAQVIRNLLESGRPRGVISTFLWEGWGNAVAVRQAARRERAWRRSRR